MHGLLPPIPNTQGGASVYIFRPTKSRIALRGILFFLILVMCFPTNIRGRCSGIEPTNTVPSRLRQPSPSTLKSIAMSPTSRRRKILTQVRRLIPFLSPAPISSHKAKQQDASPLYSRLPPELRQIIWEIYFRWHIVHISYSRGKLRAVECLERHTDRIFVWGPHFGVCGPATPQCNHISLLLTCKKAYISRLICLSLRLKYINSYFECIHTLYRETYFDFSKGLRCTTIITKQLPVSNLALISRVNLKLGFSFPLRLKVKKPGKWEILWMDIWEALSALKGLQWLRFELSIFHWHLAHEWTELEWTLWQDARKVTSPSYFELILPFPAAASTREDTLPCTAIRRIEAERPF